MKNHLKAHVALGLTLGLFFSIISAYVIVINQNDGLQKSFLSIFWSQKILFQFLRFIAIYAFSYGCVLLVAKMSSKHQGESTSPSKNQSVLFFSVGILASIVGYYLMSILLMVLVFKMGVMQSIASVGFGAGNFLITIGISLVVVLVIYGFYMREQVNLLKIKNQQTELILQQNQISTLQQQLSPHFLFNNLNVLISTIEEDPIKAKQFARNFVKIYQTIVQCIDEQQRSIEQEVELIQQYVYLLNVRYDNAIALCIAPQVSKYYDYLLPSLSLQQLIENVVKHNIIPTSGQLEIAIFIHENALVVSNDIKLKLSKEPSTAVGLENLSQRFKIFKGKSIEIEQTKDKFTVRLPL